MKNFFNSLFSDGQNRRNSLLILTAIVVILQIVSVILMLPSAADKTDPSSQQIAQTQPSDTPQVTPPDDDPPASQPDVPSTAYYNIVPSEGKYASQISQYISWERSQMQSDEVVLSFTGDCTLGTWPEAAVETNFNTVYEQAGSETYPFDLVKSLFANDDYTYINLETTLTNSTDRLKKDTNYNFKGDPEWAKTMIAASYIDGCTLSNNHSYDYRSEGYSETMTALKNAGVDVGSQRDILVTNVGGVEIVMLGANYITSSLNPEDVFGDKLTELMIQQIQYCKRPDNIVIVNCHWGLERHQDANGDQAQPAHKMIDAGADMIIGHHPHTVQGVEIYKGKYIFYSLGNFSFGGKNTTDDINRVCIVVRPRFALRDNVASLTGVTILPCYTTSAENTSENNYQPTLVFGKQASSIIRTLKNNSAYLPYPCKEFVCPTVDYTNEVSPSDA